jgi:hypothetical protein
MVLDSVSPGRVRRGARTGSTLALCCGPASKTRQPLDYQRRIAIMQAYLRSDSFRLTTDLPETENRRALNVEIKRQTCTWTVPFVAIKTGDGSWLVNQVDLTAAGNPARPCVEGQGADSLPKQ